MRSKLSDRSWRHRSDSWIDWLSQSLWPRQGIPLIDNPVRKRVSTLHLVEAWPDSLLVCSLILLTGPDRESKLLWTWGLPSSLRWCRLWAWTVGSCHLMHDAREGMSGSGRRGGTRSFMFYLLGGNQTTTDGALRKHSRGPCMCRWPIIWKSVLAGRRYTIYMTNRRGPRTLPWGTPLDTSTQSALCCPIGCRGVEFKKCLVV
jgi:hypothetical protein